MSTIPARSVCTTLATLVEARANGMRSGPLRDALRQQAHDLRALADRLGRARHADLRASGCDAGSLGWLTQIAASQNGRAELVEHLRETGHPRADEVAALHPREFVATVRIVCGVAEQ